MFKLKKDNVIRLTDSARQRDRYIEQGYVLVNETTKKGGKNEKNKRDS